MVRWETEIKKNRQLLSRTNTTVSYLCGKVLWRNLVSECSYLLLCTSDPIYHGKTVHTKNDHNLIREKITKGLISIP